MKAFLRKQWWPILVLSTLSLTFPKAYCNESVVQGRRNAIANPLGHAVASTRNVFGRYRRRSTGPSTTVLASNKQPWRSESRPYVQGGVPKLPWDEIESDHRARPYFVNLSRRRPNSFSVTSKIIAITVASYALQTFMPRWTQIGIKLSAPIRRGEQLYRLVTPILLHGNIFHLFVNMQSLSRTGGDFEKLYGRGRYLATYLAAGVAGNVASAFQSPNPGLGASGAVFGIYGASFVYFSRNEWLLGAQGQAISTSIGQTMLMNLLLGLMNPQIDQWAHAGGAIAGAVMAYMTGPNLYLAQNPNTGERMVIDRPHWRAPRAIESLPEKCMDGLGTVRKTLFGWVPGLGVGNKPWQRSGNKRRYAPNRSLKPKNVDDVSWGS